MAVVYGDTITVSKNARVSDHLLKPPVIAVTRLLGETDHSLILYSQLFNYSTVDYLARDPSAGIGRLLSVFIVRMKVTLVYVAQLQNAVYWEHI